MTAMTTAVRAWLDDLADGEDAQLLVMDGYDDCIVGVAGGCNRAPVVVYDTEKVITKLMADGMTREEAIEFHEFNQAGAYMGEGTPIFLVTVPPHETDA